MIRDEYMIVSGESIDDLERRVNSYLETGWKLHHGPAMAYNPGRGEMVCIQAVVKEYEQPGAWG